MLSPVDLERLIAAKRREIEKEKTLLGLPVTTVDVNTENDKELSRRNEPRRVNFEDILCESNDAHTEDKKERDSDTQHDRGGNLPCEKNESEVTIPADLERYIRRYLGLPVMLKAGEYSPNNPLIRAERNSGDVLLGLGEYERRRNTLRKLRQQQYREYLDQQAKKKQESREQADRERREREEREREREERERELLERERTSPGRRRISVSYANNSGYCSNKVETGVQVDSVTSPLSVAVQTDDADFFQVTSRLQLDKLPPSPSKSLLTQAERELSPRTVADPQDERRIQPAPWTMSKWQDDTVAERRRSYGDFDERSSSICKRTPRERLVSDLRHSYMPSIFDADAIQMRNLQAEKEAAERRQFYQQELKNQILEQQRIKEERKTREKMLEQAEMRRLEEQLRMLRVAQEREVGKHQEISAAMQDEAIEYTKKRTDLQKEIDIEHQSLLRASTHPPLTQRTCHSDTNPSKLPFYYPRLKTTNDKPYSTNIPDNSIFSPNYDVDSYLRRNLNFKDNRFSHLRRGSAQNIDIENIGNKKNESNRNVIVEKAMVHDFKDCKTRNFKNKEKDPSDDSLPIPVLRHSPLSQVDKVENDILNDAMKAPLPPLRHSLTSQGDKVENDNLSNAMKIVDDKWKVPAVQKNILRSLPNEEGKNVSILTQLGSIRRQLQLEQLKLDKMNKEDDV